MNGAPRRLLRVIAAALIAASPVAAQAPSGCAPARTALVLGGGGAKGFAHIGVLQVLDSIGVKPDLIVGTSIGAVIGMLYASGYSAAEIDSITRAFPLERAIGRYDPSVSSALGLLRPVAVWEEGGTGYALQSGAVRESEVNALVSALALRGNLLARGSFDSLEIPFRAVATDIESRHAVVFSSGDLARAVRASVAIPVVFRPLRVDGRWLTDGGIADNVPVGPARALGAERVWVSYMPWVGSPPESLDDPVALSRELLASLFRQDSIVGKPGDVVVETTVKLVQNLDFRRRTLDSVIRVGHDAAAAAFRTASCLRPLGAARRRALPSTVGTIATPGVPPSDVDAVLAELRLAPATPLAPRAIVGGLRALGDDDRYRALWLNPSGGGDSVSFAPTLDQAPLHAFGIGVAYDHFMSGRLWIGGIRRSIFNGDADAFAVARVGAYEQDAMGFVRRHALVNGRYVPFTIGASTRFENTRQFVGRTEVPSAETREAGAFIGIKEDPAQRWQVEFGLDARAWKERSQSSRGTVGLRGILSHARSAWEMGSSIELLAMTSWQRALVDVSEEWNALGIEWRGRLRGGWGRKLPLQHTFVLGGDDGFAGYRLTEVRGSQEAFASLTLRRQVLNDIRVRADVMTGGVGRTDTGVLMREPGTIYGRALLGGRIGLEANTPIGPILISEGANADGLRAAFIRVGYWF